MRAFKWFGWFFVLACMAFLNFCYMPVNDDWLYLESSWGDIIPSACHEYMTHNGRFFSCLLTRVFSLSPIWLVDVVNTVGFMLLFLLLPVMAFGRHVKTHFRAPALPWLLWVLLIATAPLFGENFLWHCGCAFYLWPALFQLGFLLLFLRGEERLRAGENASIPLPLLLLLCPLAFVMGSFSENTSAAILAGAGMLAVLMWRQGGWPALRSYIPLLIFGGAGWLFLVLAPGPHLRLERLQAMSGYQDDGKIALILQMLEVHLRAIPLYIILFFAIRHRLRAGTWSKQDTRFACLMLATGLLCQAAFLATSATPPLRAQQMTFTMVSIVALRVLLPLLQECRRRHLWAGVLAVLAALPMLTFPKVYREHQWQSAAIEQMYARKDSGEYLVLPYWPFTKDRLFCTLREFVPSERSEDGIARRFGLSGIRQSDKRCTYRMAEGAWSLEGASYDRPGYVTLTEWKLEGEPEEAGTLYLHIAYPDYWKKRLSPREVFRTLCPRREESLAWQEIEKDGFLCASLRIEPGKLLAWERGKRYSKKPECPTLWIALSPEAQAGAATVFRRVEATRE